jgi:hypothetical protein
MLRWDDVEEQELFDMTVKMYREPFHAAKKTKAIHVGLELDHYAYLYLGSELFMYRIMDVNWESFMEERGDMSRIKEIYIPQEEDITVSVL